MPILFDALFLSAGLVLHQGAPEAAARPQTPTPAAPASSPPATEPFGQSSWKDVDPAAIGPVRPLLVDRPDIRRPVTKHWTFDRTVIGEPGAIAATSGTPLAAFLTFRAGRIELRTVHRETGAVSSPITTLALRKPAVAFDEGPDGISVVVRAETDSPILIVDVLKGSIRAVIEPQDAGPGDVFVVDDSTIAVVTTGGSIRRFAIADGAFRGGVQVAPMFPIASGRGQIIGWLHSDPPNAPGVTKERRMVVASIQAETGKETGRIDIPAGPSASTPRSPAIAFGEVGNGWTSVRVLDVVSLEERSKVPMSPEVHSLGLELSPDGKLLYMVEYMAQPVIAWDTASGAPVAVFGPERGGYLRSDISNDGRSLVGIVGPWINGKLAPDAFEWTDLQSPVAPEPGPASR
jgi:hypothetical protein